MKVQKRARIEAAKHNGEPKGPREVVVPADGAKRINEAWRLATQAKQRAHDITDAVLAGMGLELPEPGSAFTWNVADGPVAGSLIARWGPRMGGGGSDALATALAAALAEKHRNTPAEKPN